MRRLSRPQTPKKADFHPLTLVLARTAKASDREEAPRVFAIKNAITPPAAPPAIAAVCGDEEGEERGIGEADEDAGGVAAGEGSAGGNHQISNPIDASYPIARIAHTAPYRPTPMSKKSKLRLKRRQNLMIVNSERSSFGGLRMGMEWEFEEWRKRDRLARVAVALHLPEELGKRAPEVLGADKHPHIEGKLMVRTVQIPAISSRAKWWDLLTARISGK
ncbi:hypothetical protein BDK51DRAFT_43870 [Blyttiomyces helicus]|uniref:Uncharacterized protein n=1 Tax=Blyttiomyces helicus TaxID=388810 RepID=A0A4P9WE31_9FUNG|nr:hypothetical protein BDK51DRAFT_43870 [Blyttiomyces helicus]|eukprot:RKO90971.1 hypothetical protein BDK51DRAFT_43870 [Blyttiomyces helicus]